MSNTTHDIGQRCAHMSDPTDCWECRAEVRRHESMASCQACGYALGIHRVAAYSIGAPDPNGGCPTDEVDAMRRMGLL